MVTTTFDTFHAAIQAAGCYCWTDGTEHVARCPSHQDDNPSMGYRQGTNGAAVVAHCFAGCDFSAMVRALGLPGPAPVLYSDSPPARRRSGNGSGWRGTPLALYEYCNAHGIPVHRTVRWGKDHTPPFTQERYESGRWTVGLAGLRPLLYRLPQLNAAPIDQLVLWPEGEKDADNLAAAGLLATTHPLGAENWDKVDLTPLADRPVTVLGDNDDTGRRTAAARAHALLSLAAEVRCLPSLPDVPEHGDVTDFLAVHGGPAALIALITATPPLLPSPTSWDPVDLDPVLAGTSLDAPPSMLARSDGLCLLYAGKIHAFNGEPEAGKGLAALFACAERITAGEHVLYVDFEDVAATAVARLLALGVDPALILSHFHYVRPDEPLVGPAVASIEHVLRRYGPTLCIVDGVTEALALHGWDGNDSGDAARFLATIPRRLARRGAAVVDLDHVGKDRARRHGYAIGSQHKKAGIDVAYEFVVNQPFGRGRPGHVSLYIAKDRPGHVRGHSGSGPRPLAADFHFSSDPTGTVATASLQAPVQSPAVVFRPTHLMERVSLFLEAAPEPLTQNTITDGVIGKKEHLRQALACLVADGYVEQSEGPRRSRLFSSVQPFREASPDNQVPLGPTGSPLGPGTRTSDWFPGSLPEGGDPDREPVSQPEEPPDWVPPEDDPEGPWR